MSASSPKMMSATPSPESRNRLKPPLSGKKRPKSALPERSAGLQSQKSRHLRRPLTASSSLSELAGRVGKLYSRMASAYSRISSPSPSTRSSSGFGNAGSAPSSPPSSPPSPSPSPSPSPAALSSALDGSAGYRTTVQTPVRVVARQSNRVRPRTASPVHMTTNSALLGSSSITENTVSPVHAQVPIDAIRPSSAKPLQRGHYGTRVEGGTIQGYMTREKRRRAQTAGVSYLSFRACTRRAQRRTRACPSTFIYPALLCSYHNSHSTHNALNRISRCQICPTDQEAASFITCGKAQGASLWSLHANVFKGQPSGLCNAQDDTRNEVQLGIRDQ